MTETSARLALPFLQAGQAQKEVYHNEALALLDIAVQPAVHSSVGTEPPTNPVLGDCWIVPADATGAWSGRTGAIAGWTSAGWRFVDPSEGMLAWDVTEGLWRQWTDDAWVAGRMTANGLWVEGVQVVGPQASDISPPSGGTIADAEAREAIEAILQALRGHGLIAS